MQVFTASKQETKETVIGNEAAEGVSIAEIDGLIEQRTQALIENHQKSYDKINALPKEKGPQTVALEKVIALTGSLPMPDGSARSSFL